MSSRQPKCSCIIPFYNEADRIATVLSVVSQVESLDEIICVDDASTDQTAEIIRKQFPQVKIVTLKKNGGKANAIHQGLKKVKNEYVLLLDADLLDLTVPELEEAIQLSLKKEVDMTILRRVKAPLLLYMNRSHTLTSGQRILKVNTLKEIFTQKPENFQLEMVMNKYTIENNKRVYWYPISAKNTYKIDKFEAPEAIIRELATYTDIISPVGIIGYLYQIAFFCHEDLRD